MSFSQVYGSNEPYGLKVHVNVLTGERVVEQVMLMSPEELPGLWAYLKLTRRLDTIRFDEIESKRRGDKIRAFFKIGSGPERPLGGSR